MSRRYCNCGKLRAGDKRKAIRNAQSEWMQSTVLVVGSGVVAQIFMEPVRVHLSDGESNTEY